MMSTDYFEIMSDLFEDLREWDDFEADAATNPWD